MAIWPRLRAPILFMRLARWNLTVRRLMWSSSAISALVRPWATVSATSSSRSVRTTLAEAPVRQGLRRHHTGTPQRRQSRESRDNDNSQAIPRHPGRCETGSLRTVDRDAVLDGKVSTRAFTVNQIFLTLTLIFILLPTLMVVLSLRLKPRVNRILNIVVSLLYMITIIGSCIGEQWAYYILGSVIEVILLVFITRSAWKWPPPQNAPLLP